MEPLTFAALGFSALGAVSRWFGSEEQARRIREQTAEQERRLRLAQGQQLGQAEAAGAASGFEFKGGSLQMHLQNMREEFARQAAWMQRAGNRVAQDISTAGTFGALTDLGGGLFNFGKSQNWWRPQEMPSWAE